VLSVKMPSTVSDAGKLGSMAFKMRFTEKQDEYETSDAYDFLEGGVLSITFGNEAQWTEYHAPGRWMQVTAEPNHPPGRAGGDPDVWVVPHG
jgi:hypothetical protein